MPEALIPRVYQAITLPARLLFFLLPSAFVRFAAAFEGDALSIDKQCGKLVCTATAAVFRSTVDRFAALLSAWR